MCTINLTLDETLVEKVRPYIADDKALERWVQQLVEEAVLDFYARQKTHRAGQSQSLDGQDVPDMVLGLLGAGLPLADDDLNGRKAYYQHLEEKHK